MSDSAESLPNLFQDDTDEDVTYAPSENDRNSSDTSSHPGDEERLNHTRVNEPPPKRRKHDGRKKTRRPHLWKKNIASKARNEGKQYTDRKGKTHDAKKVIPFNHECRFKCNENLNEEKRNIIFSDYWKLGDWELQSSFLNSAVSLDNPYKKKSNAISGKSLTCKYYLAETRVCKEFFLKTLNISNKRITNVIKKKQKSVSGVSPRDNRGHKPAANKTSPESESLVMEHISKFPKYSSHYSRVQSPNRRYLNPYLNITKLYKLYLEYLKEKGSALKPVTLSYYRHIFNTKFNLSFHKPHTDTCNTCDRLQITINNGTQSERDSAMTAKELHLRKSDSATTEMTKATERSKTDPSHVAICFDLQKTLPSPLLTCSKVYYSRQLWTYNLCVHDMANSNACMFLWHEGQASRGCEEVMSCLLKYITSLPSTVTHLTTFSDNCGGQNKSQYIVKFWMYVVNNFNIQTVDHKFLQSGHSYNDCDRDFGIIEKAKRRHERGIFVPEDWVEVIAKSNRKFLVTRMKDEDFVALDEIQHLFVKSVVGISKMQWLQFRKTKPWTLFYKNTFNADFPFLTYNMKAKNVGRTPVTLPSLKIKKERKKIKPKKHKDLLNLLQFIPPIHHEFYRKLVIEGSPTSLQTNQTPSFQQADEAAEEDQELENIYDTDSE